MEQISFISYWDMSFPRMSIAVCFSDGTIPKFTSIPIPMPIPIKCSISIPILDSDSRFQL